MSPGRLDEGIDVHSHDEQANVPKGFHGPDCDGHDHGCMPCAMAGLMLQTHLHTPRVAVVVRDNGSAEAVSTLSPRETASVLRQLAAEIERRGMARMRTYVDRGAAMPPV